MTKKEIARLFGYREEYVGSLFDEAAKTHETIKAKRGHYSKMKAIDYTLEECLYAMSFLKVWNPMMKQYLVENFIKRDGMYYDRTKENIKLSKDAKDFMYLNKRWFNYQVCNNCAYCVPKQLNHAGSKDHPFCSFYEVFLYKIKANVYKDRCQSWKKTEREPRIWELPRKVEKKIIGIEVSRFKPRKSPDEPIILLGR